MMFRAKIHENSFYFNLQDLLNPENMNIKEWIQNGGVPDLEEIKFYCDNQRHLVCVPYSIENLHLMAKILDIDECWFHSKNKPGRNRSHYDIPKKRIEEIMNQCEIVSSEDIVNICKGEYRN